MTHEPSRSNGDWARTAPLRSEKQVRLGPALRRAWLGYQRRLDEEMAAAGFGDRMFPDGRVLRMCSDSSDTTISQISRELEITRQGAGKIVAILRGNGYLTLTASSTDRREKIVTLTPLAMDHLAAQRTAAGKIERQLQSEVGDGGFAGLHRLLEALGGDEEARMSPYLRRKGRLGGRQDREE